MNASNNIIPDVTHRVNKDYGGKNMVTVRMSDDTYALIRRMVASSLDAEMLHGKVLEWDDINCDTLRALVELNFRVTHCGIG